MEQKHLAQLLMKTSHKGSDNVFNIYSVSTTINKIILTSDPFVVVVKCTCLCFSHVTVGAQLYEGHQCLDVRRAVKTNALMLLS